MHHPLPGAERNGAAGRLVAQADLIDELRRNLAQKARRLRVKIHPVQAPVPGITQCQLAARPGNAYVAQAPFLLQLRGIIRAALVREQAFFHADQVNPLELQSLGGVQRHQVDGVAVGVSLGLACFKRGPGQKRSNGFQVAMRFFIRLKLPRGGDQFLQVLNAGKPPLALLLAIMFDQPAGPDNAVHGLVRFLVAHELRHLLNEFEKLRQRGERARRHEFVRCQRPGGLP